MTLKISQIFGPTFQGEGSAAGRHCLFLRTYDCNLTCHFCDTPYTWANTDERARMHREQTVYPKVHPLASHEMSTDEVLAQLDKLWAWREHPTIIVVSGGEPMMQQNGLVPVTTSLRLWRCEVHIETAGTIAPSYEFGLQVNQYNVSPKLESSGNRWSKRYKPEVLRILRDSGKAWFKFVIGADSMKDDLDEVDQIVKDCSIAVNRVMLMPEGTNSKTVIDGMKVIAPEALERGYGLSSRMHTLIWENDPGK